VEPTKTKPAADASVEAVVGPPALGHLAATANEAADEPMPSAPSRTGGAGGATLLAVLEAVGNHEAGSDDELSLVKGARYVKLEEADENDWMRVAPIDASSFEAVGSFVPATFLAEVAADGAMKAPFLGAEEGELSSIKQGASVWLVAPHESVQDGWVLVISATGDRGYIPTDYVEWKADTTGTVPSAPPYNDKQTIKDSASAIDRRKTVLEEQPIHLDEQSVFDHTGFGAFGATTIVQASSKAGTAVTSKVMSDAPSAVAMSISPDGKNHWGPYHADHIEKIIMLQAVYRGKVCRDELFYSFGDDGEVM